MSIKADGLLLVGDLDSISESREYRKLPREKIKSFPKNKDDTDTEIGLNYFKEMSFKRIILVAAGAGGMRSEGLKWPLDGINWRRGEAGISNVFTADRGRISVGEGKLLMIRNFPERSNV